jgi:hypothetical protein
MIITSTEELPIAERDVEGRIKALGFCGPAGYAPEP